MDAGRTLDALVAEKVMGWIVDWGKHGPGDYITTNPKDDEDEWRELPRYSTDLAATVAMEQEIARRGLQDAYTDALLALKPESDFTASDHWWLATAPPRARCLAALRAVGVEVPQ